jgi:hypothetical protein
MSFGFVAQDQKWEDGTDERSGARCAIRNLLDVDLLDVSPVTYPAYAGTSASVRSMSMFTEEIPADVLVECRSRGIAIPSLATVVKVSEDSRRADAARRMNTRLL